MVEKRVGTSLGRELGLRRVARFSLAHANERAPGRLVQERAVGEIHLVENLPPLVDGRRACAEIKFRAPGVWGYLRVIDPSGGGTGRVIAATGQLTGAHNLDAIKAALKTTR